MADIAGGFIMPHDPLMFTAPQALGPERRARVDACYAQVARRLKELAVDTVMVVGADHYIMFGPGCLPQYLIGIGEADGPVDRLPGLDKGPLPVDAEMARCIRDHASDQGHDWAVATSLAVDHSVMIPWQLCGRPGGVSQAIPVYLASGVQPLLPKRRAFELGVSAGAAVRGFAPQRRVAVIGSGGISHWVGMARMGEVNEAFDRWVLERVTAGDAQALIALDDDAIVQQAGNGALEIRAFLFAMGFTGTARGEVIGYEPAPEWITGLGFAELFPAQVS